jgi:hypothetical protein
MKKDNRGGKRDGAGRHKHYDEPTKKIINSVPISKEKEFRIKVEAILTPWKIKK